MEFNKNLVVSIILILLSIIIWKIVKFIWLRPKQIEKFLRQQGLQGSPYKLLIGDGKNFYNLQKEASLKPINLSDDNLPRIVAFIHHTIRKYGKNCFTFVGPVPWLIITDPESIKEVLANHEDFPKPNYQFLKKLLVGLFCKEGDTWAKHRKIINPAFHMEKLKIMCSMMNEACTAMISSWEKLLSKDESIELDVLPFLEALSGDVISRVAFGSSYEEGRRIFDLQNEHIKLLELSQASMNHVPGWRFIPTKKNRRIKKIIEEMERLLTRMIDSRKQKIMENEGSTQNDLLDMLLESNMREIKEHGNDQKRGLSTKDVVDECQLFYLAGSDTSSSLLVWTLILLSKHQIWQEQARTEVLQVFGKDGIPNFDGLSRLKIVTAILYEVLRLNSPSYMLMRKTKKDIKLRELMIPEGTELAMPICILHQDCSVWGEDAKEFKPQRFAEGVTEATKGQPIFYPFGAGPRICIGKNVALVEVKCVLTMILQRFSFHLSPTYVHAPIGLVTVRPQYGANLILRKINC